jgi:hypothetical protein
VQGKKRRIERDRGEGCALIKRRKGRRREWRGCKNKNKNKNKNKK